MTTITQIEISISLSYSVKSVSFFRIRTVLWPYIIYVSVHSKAVIEVFSETTKGFRTGYYEYKVVEIPKDRDDAATYCKYHLNGALPVPDTDIEYNVSTFSKYQDIGVSKKIVYIILYSIFIKKTPHFLDMGYKWVPLWLYNSIIVLINMYIISIIYFLPSTCSGKVIFSNMSVDQFTLLNSFSSDRMLVFGLPLHIYRCRWRWLDQNFKL